MKFVKQGTSYRVSAAFKDKKEAKSFEKFLKMIFPKKNILFTPIDFGKVSK